MTDDRENKKEEHESYAMMQINRVHNGKDTTLFGSSIEHNDTVRLTIKKGVVERTLSRDWYYSSGMSYIEVEMSQAQFAEAITNMNVGSGTPVTLRRLSGKSIPEPDFKNKRIEFEAEFKAKMENLQKQLAQLTEQTTDILENKKSINKGDRQIILNQINKLHQEIASNIPFMSSSYNEQMDRTTREAKAEVEAFTLNKLHELGLTKLKDLNGLPDTNQNSNQQIESDD